MTFLSSLSRLEIVTQPSDGDQWGDEMNSTSGYRIVAAGIIGNVLEWYDFAIYDYIAARGAQAGVTPEPHHCEPWLVR